MEKRKLSTSLIFAIVIFTIALSFCLGLIGYKTFYGGMIKKYKTYEETVLNLVISDFDWDAVAVSIQNQEEDEAIQALRARLNYIKSNSEISYLYMLEPLNTNEIDNMRYICEGYTPAEVERGEDVVKFGKMSGSEYPVEVAADYLNFFNNSKKDEFWYYPNKTEWGYVFTTSRVVRSSTGKPLGVLSVDIYMSDIGRTLRIFPLVIFTASLIFSVIFILILTLWLEKRVVIPLSKLQKSAEQFLKSSHDKSDPASLTFTAPDIKTKDEIEDLSTALLTMASDLKSYMKNLMHETAEKERIGAELNVATHIQSSMLPIIFPPFPSKEEVDIFASMTPAKEVGGDFYDFFMVDDRHIAIVVADVSGKGVPAALFMVIGKTLIKDHTTPGMDPAEVFMKVNNLLCESNGAELFITAFEGVLDIVTGEFRFVDAGHEPPYIWHDGKFTAHRVKPDFVLAGFEGTKYASGSIFLEPGDKILEYTDGVNEATNANNELYGDERLNAVLNRDNCGAKSCKDIISTVKADIDRFVADAPQFDDITMLCLEFKKRLEI